jgi:hypothetical protein
VCCRNVWLAPTQRCRRQSSVQRLTRIMRKLTYTYYYYPWFFHSVEVRHEEHCYQCAVIHRLHIDLTQLLAASSSTSCRPVHVARVVKLRACLRVQRRDATGSLGDALPAPICTKRLLHGCNPAMRLPAEGRNCDARRQRPMHGVGHPSPRYLASFVTAL